MIVGGIDVGSLTTKVMIMKDDEIVSKGIILTTEEGEESVRRAVEEILEGTGVKFADLECILSTGVGRKNVSFAHKNKTITTCVAKGAYKLFPKAKAVIDVGAENCLVIKLSETGAAKDSASNDKCASGTGVFLDTMARLMRLPIAEFSQRSLLAQSRPHISSVCAVFAESEVVSHVHREPPTPMNDIIAGIHDSIVDRISGLCKRIGITGEVALTGGVARNAGFAKALEEKLHTSLLIPEEPEMVGALGAALLAQRP